MLLVTAGSLPTLNRAQAAHPRAASGSVGFLFSDFTTSQRWVFDRDYFKADLKKLDPQVQVVVTDAHAAQTNQQKKTVRYLILTILLACVFLGIKYVEYAHKFHDGLLPGIFYAHQAEDLIKGTHGYATFFAFYFMMTGLHGIHVLVGIGLLSWLVMRARRGDFSSEYYTPVDLVGLYWHIVDMIWIYLFPLYYLIS